MVQEVGVGGLINYSGQVDRYTRFICYVYYDHTEYLSDDGFELLRRSKPPMPDTHATHVIVLVNWGIYAVLVLQLPPDDSLTRRIDSALENLCASMSNDHATKVLSQDDKHFIDKIVYTEVFCSIPDLCKINSIIDFYSAIPSMKSDRKGLKPYNYNLCSIESFYAVNNGTQGIFKELHEQHVLNIEHYLLQLASCFRKLRIAIDQGYPNLRRHLKDYFSERRTKWSDLEGMYVREIERVHDLVLGIRRGKIEQKRIHEVLDHDKKKELLKSIDIFDYDLNLMKEKENVIRDLLEKDFEYRNANDYGVKNGDDEETIARKLFSGDKPDRVVYFNDILRTRNKPEWGKLDTQLIKEHKENSRLRIIYVDFSYCSYELNRLIILPTIKKETDVSTSKPATIPAPSERPKTDGSINVLLLGETGVGKSTFINAFVNYLTFKTLEQAQKKPIVLIPVSFLMTIGDEFQERTVTFGGTDTLNNEDHDHPGQSVTQHCKSYIFTFNDNDNKRRKLRIIDTPGIGDVRGLAQDDINMQHILSYINNLTHLNAICILMKPNNSRLNVFFRTCLMQLFDFLGENARDKIIFCFTNSRATFYTPGNTAPLLKELLKSLPVKNIPFTKNNTFCFDSESFRYLVATQNQIRFDDSDKKDYEESWNKSSNESKRCLEYIFTELTTALIPGEYKSMKDAQLKICLMIRPILEAMRNILRNIVLWNSKVRMISIELCPKGIEDPKAICLTCPHEALQVGDFWITTDSLHAFHNKCRTCECNSNDHHPVDYELGYKLCDYPAVNSSTEMTKMIDDLCEASAEFSYFLVGTTDTSQNDLFLIGVERMIKEEDDICANKPSRGLNSNLLNHLKQLKKDYEEARKKLLTEKPHIPLSNVYDKIQQVSSYPMVKSQMAAVNAWHKDMIKYYEHEVTVQHED
jgi:GTP-binding protein EngB required for normal cell division